MILVTLLGAIVGLAVAGLSRASMIVLAAIVGTVVIAVAYGCWHESLWWAFVMFASWQIGVQCGALLGFFVLHLTVRKAEHEKRSAVPVPRR